MDRFEDVFHFWLVVLNLVSDEVRVWDVWVVVGNMRNMSMCFKVEWVGVERWDGWLLLHLDRINMMRLQKINKLIKILRNKSDHETTT